MKFDINFVEKKYFSLFNMSKLGLGIFMMSLLSTIFFVGAYEAKLTQVKVQGLADQKPPKTIPVQEKASIHYSDEAIEKITLISKELSIPWDALLNELEQIDIKGLTLLSLAPNFKSKSVVLTGNSKSMEAVLDYVEKLENLPMLSEVYLQKHTIEPEKNAQPVSFTIVAKWAL